jgi:hypothetical protein
MKTRNRLFMITACLIALTLIISNADARTITFKAKRCGVATVDPADLNDDPSITVHSFAENGTLTGATATPLPGMWAGINYSCNGFVAEIALTTGKYKFASGVCRFRDKDGNSIMANMSSTGNNVEFQFRNGTGSWSGVTGIGKGTGSMPFAGGGTGQQCAPVTIKINTP